MNTLTLNISTEIYSKIETIAKDNGMTKEELLLTKIEEWFNKSPQDLDTVINYVLEKNQELYQRLA